DRLALREILVAPRKEPVAGGAETIPYPFFAAPRHRADRLPLRLELFDGFRRLNPAGRVGQPLGLLAERDLLGEVLGPLLRLRREVRLADRPDLIVRRLEPAPERVGLRARHVGGLSPSSLELADLRGDDLRVLGRAQRLHLGAQLLLDAR